MPLSKPAPFAATLDTQRAIEAFLYFEAELLDDGRLDEWLDLLASDLSYKMPLRRTVASNDAAKEYSGVNELAYFDDDKASVQMKLRRLQSGSAWSEEPRSRTRHLVSNVRIRPGEDEGTFDVKSSFLCHRGRSERSRDTFTGERRDVLRGVTGGAGFEIVRRVILLDQATLLAHNLSFFF